MANYSVRLYKTAGFNAVNIPDSPSLVESLYGATAFNTTSINIMQDRALSEIRVRAEWDAVKDVDYLKLGTADPQFYFVNGITMLAKDTAALSVSIDYINTVGGVSNISILDGITSRVHVTDDGYGKYCEDDPLTAPAQPLELKTVWITPNDQDSPPSHTYVEATVNLPLTAASAKGKKYETVEGKDVVVPEISHLGGSEYTHYKIQGVTTKYPTSDPMTMLYDMSNTTGTGDWNNREAIMRGLAACRALGIEQGAVINQVEIPRSYAEPTVVAGYETVPDPDGEEGDTITIANFKITDFTGKEGVAQQSTLKYIYSGARNKRVYYGNYTPFGLITCSGESCEYDAEDIYDTDYQTYPAIKWVADPHTNGKPYFRWRTVNSKSGEIDFFRNCVTGLPWKQIPLFYRDPSGTAINRLNYTNSRRMAETERDIFYRNADKNAYMGSVSNLAGVAADLGAGLEASGNSNLMDYKNRIVNQLGLIVNTATNEKNYDQRYFQEKRNEMSEYLVNATIQAPTINFPYNTELMRDIYGNGVLAYRYQYTPEDVLRIDKLLSMYGYKYTKPLEVSDFMNKQNYNYVECSNVTVMGHARWLNDGVAMMLRNGVRVWHVAPNPALYTQANPNR